MSKLAVALLVSISVLVAGAAGALVLLPSDDTDDATNNSTKTNDTSSNTSTDTNQSSSSSKSTTTKIEQTVVVGKQFSYSWKEGTKTYSVSMKIADSDYEDAKNSTDAERSLESDASNVLSFVTPDDKYVSEIADQISTQLARNGVTDTETIANIVLDFVQMSITYTEDDTQYGEDEYWAYPVETLYNMKGDCEDTTFLFASIMKSMGYETVVCLVSYGQLGGHAFSMIALSDCDGNGYTLAKSGSTDSGKYYVCETTPDDSFSEADVGCEIMYAQFLMESYCFKTDGSADISSMYSISSNQYRPSFPMF